MTRRTRPSFFCRTRMSFGPTNAIVVGLLRPDTSCSTFSDESLDGLRTEEGRRQTQTHKQG